MINLYFKVQNINKIIKQPQLFRKYITIFYKKNNYNKILIMNNKMFYN